MKTSDTERKVDTQVDDHAAGEAETATGDAPAAETADEGSEADGEDEGEGEE